MADPWCWHVPGFLTPPPGGVNIVAGTVLGAWAAHTQESPGNHSTLSEFLCDHVHGHGEGGLMVGHDDLSGLFHPNDSVILYLVKRLISSHVGERGRQEEGNRPFFSFPICFPLVLPSWRALLIILCQGARDLSSQMQHN